MNHAAIEITEERTFTARLNDRSVTGLAVAGAWEGLTKYVRPNGDHLIVLDDLARVVTGSSSLLALLDANPHPVAMNEGEVYVGIVCDDADEAQHHLVLLPGEFEGLWQKAIEWAKAIGAELPSRAEQRLLFEKAKDQFQPTWYWSGEQRAADSGCAWGQYFYDGTQDDGHKSYEGRARAVRRLPI